jgi:hypothetical protein
MPIYIDIFSLILDKKVVAQKYHGGLAQFRIDYHIPASEINEEDDELFSLGQMNADEFDLAALVAKGLSYDDKLLRSDDFTITCRYGDILWKVDWLEENGVFAWHVNTQSAQKQRAIQISEMFVSEIFAEIEKGNYLLKTFRTGDV